MRKACILEVSHNQQCMQLAQGLKEKLFVHFQVQEGIDATEYFRKMIETRSRMNLAVYSKMVDGSGFSNCPSWWYGISASGV